jgi:hypothetical protein
MKEQFEEVINWIKSIPHVRGCITGSTLLEIFENENVLQDVDVFVFDEKSFNTLFYAMLYNKMFTVLDKTENWKIEKYLKEPGKYKGKHTVNTYKFKYNTCIDVNIVLKDNCTNTASVLNSFDMDIICKGYDLETKQVLDLTNGSTVTKIADWNRWNPSYYSNELWDMSRVLRQLERCIKYHNRGYNTDKVVIKYIDIIDKLQEFENVFKSDTFDERLTSIKNVTFLVKSIMKSWLKTHQITDEQLELLKTNIKLLS